MKKPIGIITFHAAINYGAVLQAVALENVFREMKIPCEIIDYENTRIKKQYGFQKDFSETNKLKKFLFFIVKNFFFFQKKWKFYRFLKKNTIISKRKYNYITVEKTKNKYSKFVTGSDQVWNQELTEGDSRYFLDFVPKEKKSSYAASFGKTQLSKEELRISTELKDYSIISLREESAIDILRKMGVQAKLCVHIDPTLLLEKAWWENKVKNRNEKKYILFYKVAPPAKLIAHVEELSERLGIPVIEIGTNLKKSSKKFKMIRNAGPYEFLELVRNAEYIATTSFHATAFAIIFHRKILVELKDVTGKQNVRIENLFLSGGINYDKKDNIVLVEECDWSQVDINIEEKRKEARAYLGTLW